MKKRSIAAVAFAVLAVVLLKAVPKYKITDLGTLGGTSSYSEFITDDGMVVGTSSTAGDTSYHAFAWTQLGGRVDIGTLGGTFAAPTAVNNNGVVVGYSTLAGDAVYHSFAWDRATGTMLDLGTLGSAKDIEANGVNNNGMVIGNFSASYGVGENGAFVWTQAGGIVDIGTLGSTYTNAQSRFINDAGMVVGDSWTAGFESWRGFAWTQLGGMVDIGTLGGTSSYVAPTAALNNKGMVVGSSDLPGDTKTGAFAWTQTGGMVDLGNFGGSYSSANAVNDNGMVVGSSNLPGDTATQAFAWTQAGGMVNLGTLGGSYSAATGVSNNGTVIGYYEGVDNYFHGFAWTQAGGMVDLGTLGGHYTFPFRVNKNGPVATVVGQSYLPGDTDSHAFAWTQAGGMVDLGTLGGTDSYPNAVNSSGNVAGYAELTGNGNDNRAVVWTFAGTNSTPQVNFGTPSSGPSAVMVPVTIFDVDGDEMAGHIQVGRYQPVMSLVEPGTTEGILDSRHPLGNGENAYIYDPANQLQFRVVGSATWVSQPHRSDLTLPAKVEVRDWDGQIVGGFFIASWDGTGVTIVQSGFVPYQKLTFSGALPAEIDISPLPVGSVMLAIGVSDRVTSSFAAQAFTKTAGQTRLLLMKP